MGKYVRRSTTYDGKGHFTGWETYIYHENGEAEKEEFHKQELIEKQLWLMII